MANDVARKRHFFKLKPWKAQVFTLPPFALAACGGGGSSGSGASSYANISGLTNDGRIDASLQGSYWTADTVTFAIAGGLNGEYWFDPNSVYERLSTTMHNVAEYTNLNVKGLGVYKNPIAAGAAGADIVLSLDSELISYYMGNNVWAVGLFPDMADDVFLQNLEFFYPSINGDMFLNINSAANYLTSYEPGSQGFTLLLHELGHALGLKHPFDRIGDQPSYADVGLIDNEMYSVMTYDDIFDDVVSDPGSFMVNDVFALMYLYGTNNSTFAGDDVHSFAADGLYETIWDAGGQDTVDISSSQADWIVYLPQFDYSTEIDIAVGWAQKNLDDDRYVDTLKWLLGNIENVQGGSGNDQLFGNSEDNIIKGFDGNDIIAGRGGNDSLYGGNGADTFFLIPGDGADVIYDWEHGIDRIRAFTDDTYSQSISTSVSETYDGKILVSIYDGSSIQIDNILYSDIFA